jgi:hypothetical protein
VGVATPKHLALAALALVARSADADPDPPTAGWFASGDLAAGALIKTEVAAGWGRPDSSWVGGEAYAITTTEFGALYAGARAHLAFLDATVGARDTASYDRNVLPVAARYSSLDGNGEPVRYVSVDASLIGYAPVPRGYALVWADLILPIGLGGRRIFEEYERVVVGRGATTAARVAYLVAVADARVLVGPVGEGVWMGGRDASAWRIGGAVFWKLSPRWSVEAILTTPIAATDDLGAWDGLWGTAAVHYRWAAPRVEGLGAATNK